MLRSAARGATLGEMHAHLLPFIAVAWLIVIAPGVDMALVTRNALSGGRGPALATALGINLGVTLWVGAAACGLAAAVQAWATAFDVVRLAGAAYLIALGITSLLRSRDTEPGEGASAARSLQRPGDAFRQGIASNLLNPKMAVLFTSLLPQFIDRGSDPLPGLLLLGAAFNVLGLIWLLGYALAVARARSILDRPRIRRLQERLTGGVLVALGLRVALERR